VKLRFPAGSLFLDGRPAHTGIAEGELARVPRIPIKYDRPIVSTLALVILRLMACGFARSTMLSS
jgi:hypothetical protein